MTEEKKFYKTHFTVPELPWKREEKMDKENEKLFLIAIHWGLNPEKYLMGNSDKYLMKAKNKEDAEEKIRKLFTANEYFSILGLDELEFDKDGVYDL